jgi:GR25 family glycosyltransferase involved in LPS biosynthesis
MDIYVITLKRKERLDNIAEQQSKIPQEIQLFDAVKGDQLDIEQLIKDNLLSPSAGFLHEVSHKRVVGCYLSHYNIYKENALKVSILEHKFNRLQFGICSR